MQELQDPIRPSPQSPSLLSLPHCSLWCLICIHFHPRLTQEKQGGNLRAFTQEAPWILLTPEKSFNTGIAVVLKTPLTLDVLLLRIPLMMTDAVKSFTMNTWFTSLPQDSQLFPNMFYL
nr:hypothetical protein CFP56_38137 [Quercus suber]